MLGITRACVQNGAIMILQDVIDLARYSELAGTAIKSNTAAIILFLNAGMTELYKRFPLSTNEHIVTLIEGTVSYPLPTDYMYIVSAYEEVAENGINTLSEIPVNDDSSLKSIYFPNHKEVQIPYSETGAYISIIYVAKPVYYTSADLAVELDLPETLINCLMHYIGYKAHLGIRGDGQSENSAHFVRFERSCDKARDLGVAHPIDSLNAVERLAQRGFV